MVDWYRHDIPAWMDGTAGLTPNAYRIYHTLIQWMYFHEGPVTLNERVLAGQCSMHILAVRHALKQLFEQGKLQGVEGGKVTNTRVVGELLQVDRRRVHAGLGGSAPRKTRNNNGRGGAMLHDLGAYKSRREE